VLDICHRGGLELNRAALESSRIAHDLSRADALELRVCPFQHLEPAVAELSDLEARIGPHRLGSSKQLVAPAVCFEALCEAVVDRQHPWLSACSHAS
jgi:hypothetical protein